MPQKKVRPPNEEALAMIDIAGLKRFKSFCDFYKSQNIRFQLGDCRLLLKKSHLIEVGVLTHKTHFKREALSGGEDKKFL